MAVSAAQHKDRVLTSIDAERDELVSLLSRGIRIESVNPKYPGQVYDEVVGREGDNEDPENVKREIEAHVARAAALDPWLREHPPVIDWKLNWPAFSVDAAHPICGAIGDAHEQASAGTRFAGRPLVRGFAAVEDCSFLNIGGMPTVSYGPGDLRVAHADDEYILIDELVAAAKSYALLAMDWCGVSV